MADPRKVEAVADREQRDAGLRGPSHAELHRLVADHLAIAALALDHQDGTLLAHDLEMAVGDQSALGEGLDVERQEADAVRIVAGQVGLDELVGDQLRLPLEAAAGGADGVNQGMQGGARRRSAWLSRVGQLAGMIYRARCQKAKTRASASRSQRRAATPHPGGQATPRGGKDVVPRLEAQISGRAGALIVGGR